MSVFWLQKISNKSLQGLAKGLIWLLCFGCCATQAATYTIVPTTEDPDGGFEASANNLKFGDELILRAGTYSQTGRRAITVNGTATNPIVIRAASGQSPLLTRPLNDYSQNNIEIVDSSYLVIRGLRFQGGSSGVRFIGGHHITFEDNEVFDTGNNAVTLNSGNSDAFIIRRNHIYRTGLDTTSPTEGEGMYLGCNYDSCRMTNSIIEGNYIHHLRGTSDGGNDGIEIKVGSYGNVVRNNVIHDTNIGTRYPCIFVYGGGGSLNLVEGNVMWNCGEAIQVVSDTVIRNNIILNSDVGITAAPHSQVAQMKNVTIVNNTIVGHGECLYIRWSGASNMILANNAVYCPNTTAVNAVDLSGATVRANVVEGGLSGVALDGNGWHAGGSVATAFQDASAMNYWPAAKSVLLGQADSGFVPPLDFNETTRTVPYDVGAYQTKGQAVNPGWKIVADFKTLGAAGPRPRAPANLKVQ